MASSAMRTNSTELSKAALSRRTSGSRAPACRVAAPEAPAGAPTTVLEAEPSLEDVPLQEIFDSYANGYLSVGTDTETACWITEVEGEIPKELTGTLLRNGPGMHERGETKRSVLDGDGMIMSLAIKDGKAYFRNKFVRTPCFQKEETDGMYHGLPIFTLDDPRPAKSNQPAWKHRLFDDIFFGPPAPKNTAAYNAWYWGGSLVAVDYAMPYGLDKHNLNAQSRPDDEFASNKYTAHSRVVKEADGSLRMCCFSPETDWRACTSTVTFREYDEAGKLVKNSKEYTFPASYLHDLIVTDNWYIVFDCPIKMDYVKALIGYPLGMNALGDTVVGDTSKEPVFRLFPRRNDGPMVEVAAKGLQCFAFHHVNGFDMDAEGKKVIFDTCTWDDFDLYFKDIMSPDGVDHFPKTRLMRFEIDTETGIATHKVIDNTPCEAPTVAPSATGVPYRHAYMMTSATSKDGVNGPLQQVTKITFDSEGPNAGIESENWIFGNHRFSGEPLFIARPGSEAEDDGWVIVPVHDGANVSTDVAILDAQKISEGPIATLKLPTYVPVGVHGSWTDEYILGPVAA